MRNLRHSDCDDSGWRPQLTEWKAVPRMNTFKALSYSGTVGMIFSENQTGRQEDSMQKDRQADRQADSMRKDRVSGIQNEAAWPGRTRTGSE